MKRRAAFTLYSFSFARLCRGPRLWLNLLFFVGMPVAHAIGMIWARGTEDQHLGWVLSTTLLFLSPLPAAMMNAYAISAREFEDGIAHILYGTVLPRWAIAASKVAAGSTVGTIGMAVALALVLKIHSLRGPLPSGLEPLGLALVAILGFHAHFLFFFFCGYSFRAPMAAGILIAFVWEVMISAIPSQLAPFTTTNLLRTFVWKGVFEGQLPPQVCHHLVQFERRGIIFPIPSSIPLILAGVAALFFGLALLSLARRPLTGKTPAP